MQGLQPLSSDVAEDEPWLPRLGLTCFSPAPAFPPRFYLLPRLCELVEADFGFVGAAYGLFMTADKAQFLIFPASAFG
jgi:hypothetical protein